MDRMVVLGLGYSGAAAASLAAVSGFAVQGTVRAPGRAGGISGVEIIGFEDAGPAIADATHLLVTVPPGPDGDPVLRRHGTALGGATALRWVGYVSTTGVYGNRDGAWVEEDTPPAPMQDRSRRRLEVERAWRDALPPGAALDVMRAGGIYGPGRNLLDDLRRGTARRVIREGHAFSRVHRDDIARAVVAAARRPAAGTRVLHLVDDLPAEQSVVVEEAARLLGVSPPPAMPFDVARNTMSPMALSFWSENRRVRCALTKSALALSWLYPDYRSGLAAILAHERCEHPPEQVEVRGP